MPRVCDGQDHGRKAGRLGGKESATNGLKRRAGRQDIVNHQNVFALNGLSIRKSKRIADIGMPRFLRRLRGLLLGVASAPQRLNQIVPGLFSKSCGDHLRLVISPRKLPAAMKRNRNNQLDFFKQNRNSRLLQQAIRQPLAQRPAAVIFELLNQRFRRLVIGAEPPDARVWIETFAQAPWAGRIGLRDGHRTMDARRGHRQLMQLGIARRAERPGPIAKCIAMGTCGGISQIGHPIQHSPQSRHGREFNG